MALTGKTCSIYVKKDGADVGVINKKYFHCLALLWELLSAQSRAVVGRDLQKVFPLSCALMENTAYTGLVSPLHLENGSWLRECRLYSQVGRHRCLFSSCFLDQRKPQNTQTKTFNLTLFTSPHSFISFLFADLLDDDMLRCKQTRTPS